MSLNPHKLEKLASLADGIQIARCPACNEAGQDSKGDHLRIYPDGRYGCCVNPGPDGIAHRKRIFALSGDHEPHLVKAKIPAAILATPPRKLTLRQPPSACIMHDKLAPLPVEMCTIVHNPGNPGAETPQNPGTLGTPVSNSKINGTLGAAESESKAGTLGTAISDSKQNLSKSCLSTIISQFELELPNSKPPGTLGTSIDTSKPGTYGTLQTESRFTYKENAPIILSDSCKIAPYTLVSLAKPSQAYQTTPSSLQPISADPTPEKLPFIDADGDLHIPFNSPPRYHWWIAEDRMSPDQTRTECEKLKTNLQ